MVDPLSYFSSQPVLHDWCNKGCGMCYPVYGMVNINDPKLLIVKSSPCGGSRFPLSLSEWSFTICLTPYNRKQNASLNKIFPFFLPSFICACETRCSSVVWRSSWCDGLSDRSFMVDPVSYLSHIKDPLLLIGKSSACSGGSGVFLSLSKWFFTICMTPYNCK